MSVSVICKKYSLIQIVGKGKMFVSNRRIHRCAKSTLIILFISMTVFFMPKVLHATEYSSQNQKHLSDVAAIAAGEWAVYAVKKDGSVWVWGGMRNSGLIGNGYTVPSESPVRMKMDGAVDVASGTKHALILKKMVRFGQLDQMWTGSWELMFHQLKQY